MHFEAIQPQPKRVDIDFLESLVVKFITPNPENPGVASATEREELSNIFLEVISYEEDVQYYILLVSLSNTVDIYSEAPTSRHISVNNYKFV